MVLTTATIVLGQPIVQVTGTSEMASQTGPVTSDDVATKISCGSGDQQSGIISKIRLYTVNFFLYMAAHILVVTDKAGLRLLDLNTLAVLAALLVLYDHTYLKWALIQCTSLVFYIPLSIIQNLLFVIVSYVPWIRTEVVVHHVETYNLLKQYRPDLYVRLEENFATEWYQDYRDPKPMEIFFRLYKENEIVLICSLVCVLTLWLVVLICRNVSFRSVRWNKANSLLYPRINESMIPGSSFFHRKTRPKYHLDVFTRTSDGFAYIGAAVVMAIKVKATEKTAVYAVTCRHVVNQLSNVFVRGSSSQMIEIQKDVFSETAIDIAYTRLTESMMQTLCVSPCKIMPVVGNLQVEVFTVSNASMGKLVEGDDFGTLFYAGSTIPGFSGAAYSTGEQVYGIHAGNEGSANYGFAADFVRLLISVNEATYKHEATAEWLMSFADSRETMAIQETINGLQVRFRGRYYQIEEEDDGYKDVLGYYQTKSKRRKTRDSILPEHKIIGSIPCYADTKN